MNVLFFKRNGSVLHSTNWIFPWVEFCQNHNIKYDFVDLFAVDIVDTLKKYDVLLWHFSQYDYQEMLEARSILYTAKKIGLKVFPDFNESWHFDDKVAEMYALQAVNAPIPYSKVFYDLGTLKNWVNTSLIQYPLVGKLRTGSGSHNVKLLRTEKELIKYAKHMLNRGYNPAPSLLYKASSNIRSSHNWQTFKSKFKRIPEFLQVLRNAKKFPNEKGYVYLQEFIPNDNFDMKVVVVGNKLSGLIRPVRSHDFRASGGGEVFYDKSFFSKELINSAFNVADALGVQCIGFDYVIDKRTGKGLIVEMSYGFSHTAVMGLNGYFDRNGDWHDGPLNAPEEILKNMLI